MPLKLPFSFTAGKKIIRYQLAEKRDAVALMKMRRLRPAMTAGTIRVLFSQFCRNNFSR
jgi:hypothetical protein